MVGILHSTSTMAKKRAYVRHVPKKHAHVKHYWIAGAVKHPGSFKRYAKSHHMTVARAASFALKKGSHASTHRKRQAALARTFSHMHHGGRHKR